MHLVKPVLLFLLLSLLVPSCTAFSEPDAFAGPDPSLGSPFGFTTSFYPPRRPPREEMEAMRKRMAFAGKPADDPPYSTALDLGVRWERPTHPVLDWSFVQRDREAIMNGTYDWTVPDNFLKNVPRDLSLVVTLNAGDRVFFPGTWQFRSPQAKTAFLEFVKKAVERYNGDGINDMPGLRSPVKYWQIENEPESHVDRRGPGRPQPNLDWRGFADLVRSTYEAIKEADGSARVLSGGIVSPPPGLRDTLIEKFWMPLIGELNGRAIDIFDFHWFDDSYRDSYHTYKRIREALDRNGFAHTEIWITETGASSKEGERRQAVELVKRFVYPLSYGVKKVFWAWALVEGWPPFDCQSMFDYTGLIYDGSCPGDPGYGVRKLGYYTYRQMTQKLSGISLANVRTLSAGEGNIFAFRFPRTGADIYVVWHDTAREGERAPFELKGVEDGDYIVTEAVPSAAEGRQVNGSRDVPFPVKRVKAAGRTVLLELSSSPVYVEKAH